jgi:hypothetical protein
MQQFSDMSWSGVWLLCSLDLSAFDYDIWGILLAEVNAIAQPSKDNLGQPVGRKGTA